MSSLCFLPPCFSMKSYLTPLNHKHNPRWSEWRKRLMSVMAEAAGKAVALGSASQHHNPSSVIYKLQGLNLSEPQCPHLWNGDIDNTCPACQCPGLLCLSQGTCMKGHEAAQSHVPWWPGFMLLILGLPSGCLHFSYLVLLLSSKVTTQINFMGGS